LISDSPRLEVLTLHQRAHIVGKKQRAIPNRYTPGRLCKKKSEDVTCMRDGGSPLSCVRIMRVSLRLGTDKADLTWRGRFPRGSTPYLAYIIYFLVRLIVINYILLPRYMTGNPALCYCLISKI
jgi:hypothetical protein